MKILIAILFTVFMTGCSPYLTSCYCPTGQTICEMRPIHWRPARESTRWERICWCRVAKICWTSPTITVVP
jgi:hypothetical protein